jgi:hypothetical protein
MYDYLALSFYGEFTCVVLCRGLLYTQHAVLSWRRVTPSVPKYKQKFTKVDVFGTYKFNFLNPDTLTFVTEFCL